MSTSERRTDRKHYTPRRNHPLLSWYALFFLLCLLLLPIPAHAQEPGPTTWEWRTFTSSKSPLAPGGVNLLIEDTQGRLWIGTDGGVSLYLDGTWQTFTADDSPLAQGAVSAFLEDSHGRIWVGTSYYDKETGALRGDVSLYKDGIWQTFTADDSPLAQGSINVLLEDSHGHIWIGTSGGVSRYKGGTWQIFTADDSLLPLGEVEELLEDSQRRIWVGTAYYDETGTSRGGIGLYQNGGWQTFSADDSLLAQGGVREFLEDSQGRIWAGTDKGVSCYHEGAWQTFPTPGSVHVFLEDSQGRIWIGNGVGVSLHQDGTWQTFTTDDSPLAPGFVRAFLEDSHGRIWVGTSSGASLYQDGVWQTFTADDSPLASGGVRKLLEDSQARIWIGTDGGVSLYKDEAWWTFTPDRSPLTWGRMEALLEDSQGRIWVGTNGGVSLYHKKAWQTFNADDSPLAPGVVEELLMGSQGRILVGTSRGVSLYQDGVWQTFTADNSPLTLGSVHVFLEDSQGRIWVGTWLGANFYRDGVWQTFTTRDSPLAPGPVHVLLEDSRGRIWIGTDMGVSLHQDGTWQTFTADDSPLAPGFVRAFLEDSQGRIWVGTSSGVSLYQDGVWQTFTADDSPLASGRVTDLLKDSRGRIWVGTGGGISLYEDEAWRTFTADDSPPTSGGVTDLLEDSRGRIWVGTGGGVNLYQNGDWRIFTTDNSRLAPGGVTDLLEDSRGWIWVGTWGGVSRYYEDAWQAFTADDSPLLSYGGHVLLEDSQGRIWVGSSRGISMRRLSGDCPCTFLRYARIDGRSPVSLRTTHVVTFTFPSPRSALEVRFSGIDVESDPDRLNFRCQLVGYDLEEVDCASPFRYPALPPGTYTFRVRALDEDWMVSKPATTTITLISTAPPSITIPGLGTVSHIRLATILGSGGMLVGGAYVLARRLHRTRRLSAWRAGADPYIVGDAIEEPEQFYGREEALAELVHALAAGNHIALYGERRIGKTSLLHQLAHRLRRQPDPAIQFMPVFLNLQMVPEPRFFYAIANAIARVTQRQLARNGQGLPPLQSDGRPLGYDSLELADDLEAIVEALREASKRLVRIVLLLDEADKMNRYDPRTQEALRGLLMTPVGGHVKLVWSGQTMNRQWHLESSPWYNLFKQEIHLGGLKKEPAVRLIREPVRGVFTYDDEAVQRILQLTGYKPYPIQRLSSFCIRRLLGENRFQITTDDVEAAWRELQAEDVRRAAEGATDLTYEPPRPAWTVAEEGTQYDTDEEKEP